MRFSVPDIKISALASVLPRETFSAGKFSAIMDEDAFWRLTANTGVKTLRISDRKTTAADLCVYAAEYLFEQTDLDKSAIDGVVFVSGTPDYKAPPTSGILQDRLGLSQTVANIDLNQGGAAYIYALQQAAMMLSSGGCRRVLLCVGDTMSKITNPADLFSRALFGDAGSATIVEKGGGGRIDFVIRTDGAHQKDFYRPLSHSRDRIMRGNIFDFEAPEEVFGRLKDFVFLQLNYAELIKFVLRETPPLLRELSELAGYGQDDAETVFFHQDSRLLLDYLIKKTGLPAGKVPVNIEYTGNTGAASLPLLISQEHARLAADGKLNKAVACGFGYGFSLGAAALDLSQTQVFAPIEYKF